MKKMFRNMCVGALLLAVGSLALSFAPRAQAQFGGDGITDEQIASAIDKLKEAIYRKQEGNGNFSGPENSSSHGDDRAVASMSVLALLVSGESMQDPRIEKGLEWLSGESTATYTVGVRAHVWSYLPHDSYLPYRSLLKKDVGDLYASRRNGVPYWGDYHMENRGGDQAESSDGKKGSGRDDLSMTQYGLLALWQGRKRGINVPNSYWDMMAKHMIQRQLADGGWNYNAAQSTGNGGISTQKMTCAGLTVLFVCREERDRAKQSPDPAIQASIDKGLAYLDANFNPGQMEGWAGGKLGYQYYGYERVALASGRRYIGGKDWFTTIAKLIVSSGASGSAVVDSFNLMFLTRGRSPVWVNKIAIPGTNEWRQRPDDIYFATHWLSTMRESELNWVIVDLVDGDASTSDRWLNAPVAYLSTGKSLELSSSQTAALKSYVDHGGLLVINCEGKSAARWAKGLCKDLYPDYKLDKLTSKSKLTRGFEDGRVSGVKSVHNGARDLVVVLESDFGMAWQRDQDPNPADAKWKFLFNLYQMSSDRGKLTNRLVSPFELPRRGATGTIRVVIPKYKGNCQPENRPYDIMNFYVQNRTGYKLVAEKDVELKDIANSGVSLVHMMGTEPYSLKADEIQAIKDFTAKGGTVLIENVGGLASKGGMFATSVMDSLESAIGRSQQIEDGPLIEGPAGANTSCRRALYRQATIEASAGRAPTVLKARSIKVNGRDAIIFSDFDITLGMNRIRTYGVSGYHADTAQKFMLNILHQAQSNKPSEALAEPEPEPVEEVLVEEPAEAPAE